MNYLNEKFNFENNDLVSVYDDLSLWASSFGLKLLNNISYKKNIKALDIGCGPGFPLLELAERLGKTCEVTGIDPWNAAIKRVKLKIKARRIQNAKIISGYAEKLPFKQDHFDLVVSNNGLNNVIDPQKSFNEISRVCKPGGEFVFTLNLPGTMKEFYAVFKETLKKMSLNDLVSKIDSHIYDKRKPIGFYKNLLKQNNFNDGSSMLNYFFIKLCFLDSWKNILLSDRLKEAFKNLEESLNKKGKIKLTIPYACFKAIKK